MSYKVLPANAAPEALEILYLQVPLKPFRTEARSSRQQTNWVNRREETGSKHSKLKSQAPFWPSAPRDVWGENTWNLFSVHKAEHINAPTKHSLSLPCLIEHRKRHHRKLRHRRDQKAARESSSPSKHGSMKALCLGSTLLRFQGSGFGLFHPSGHVPHLARGL